MNNYNIQKLYTNILVFFIFTLLLQSCAFPNDKLRIPDENEIVKNPLTDIYNSQ